MVVLPLDHGFASDAISLLTEKDILGERLVRRQKRRKSADAFLAELATLSVGDLVVHLDHGIGRYEGLQSIPVGDSPHDCAMLVYHGGDKLYLPVDRLGLVQRYVGPEGSTPPLDKLGGTGWEKSKGKARKAIEEQNDDKVRASLERLEKTLTTKYTGTHLVDGAGHWVQQERAAEVNRLLIEFLKGLA